MSLSLLALLATTALAAPSTCPRPLPLSGPFYIVAQTYVSPNTPITPVNTVSVQLGQGIASRDVGYLAPLANISTPAPSASSERFTFNVTSGRLSGPLAKDSSHFAGDKGETILWNNFELPSDPNGGLKQVVSGCDLYLVPAGASAASPGRWGIVDARPEWEQGDLGLLLTGSIAHE